MIISVPFLIVAFIFGAIIGSFLNVVILRTHTKRSLGGHSHCMSCGERLGVVDLVPIFSYLLLMARCRHCGARISPRYALIELGSGGIFALTPLLGLPFLMTATLIVFLLLLLIVFVYDIEHLIIPDEYVIALTAVALCVSLQNFENGEAWLWQLLAPLSTFAFLGGLWKVSGGRWIGLGDAKLSVPLALMVGLSHAFSFIVFSFWIGALVSGGMLMLQRLARGQHLLHFGSSRLTMRTEVPFAPFLILSFVLVYFFHADVFTFTDAFLTYVAQQ